MPIAAKRLISPIVLLVFGVLTPPTPVWASEAESNGLRVELWSETTWVAPGAKISAPQPLVKHLKVTNTKPGGGRDVAVMLMRDSHNTQEFLNVIPQQSYGGGTSDTIGWSFFLLQDQSWEARFEEKLKPDVAPGQVVVNIASVSGTGIDGLLYFTPIAFVPPNRTTAANPGVQTTNEPVNAAWGEMVYGPVTDFSLPGPLPLTFERYYAAGLAGEGVAPGALGANWVHNFDLYMPLHDSNRASIAYLGGKNILFVRALGVPGWSLNFHQEPVRYQFTQGSSYSGDYWLMDPVRELVYRFNRETGLLAELYDRHDNRLTITRGEENRIAQVSSWLSGFGTRRTLSFTYTAGRLTQVSDGTRAVSFTYDANDNLHSAANPLLWQAVAYAYADDLSHGPLLSQLTQPLGNSPFAQTFTPLGQVADQQDAYHNHTLIDYNTPTDGQTRVTDSSSSTFIFTHQDQRLGTARRDPVGNTAITGFNSREQRVSVQDRLGDTTAVAIHEPSGKIDRYTDAAGHVTTYRYAARQQGFVNPDNSADAAVFTFYDLDLITYADDSQESFSHDAQGNVISYTNRAGQTWLYTYNAWGQLLTATNPTGGVYTWSYDAYGLPSSSRNSETGLTTYGYDALGRLNHITRPGGDTVSLTHDPLDRLLTVTNELNQTTTFTYDANGNPASINDPLGHSATFTYDQMDRLKQATFPMELKIDYAYDAVGRLSELSDAPGQATLIGYDALSQPTGVTDPSGRTLSLGYDAEGVLTSLTTPLGATSTIQNNQLGFCTQWTDPLGNSTHLAYDSLGRLVGLTDPLGQTRTYTYDPAGLIAATVQPGLGTVSCTRNPLGLVSQVIDLRGQPWNFGYSDVGQLTHKTDPLGRQKTYTYDERGWLSQVVLPEGMGTRQYTYDDAGRIAGIAYPGGPVSTFSYDGAGRLVGAGGLTLEYDAANRVVDSREDGASFQAHYAPSPSNLLQSVDFDGRATAYYEYDPNQRVARVSDSKAQGWVCFAYDADGRVTDITRSNGVNTHYDYDAAGNLVHIQDGALADQLYAYDALGRPTGMSYTAPIEPDPSWVDTPLTYDAASQINSPGYAYDALGRRTAAPGRTFQYNGASQMTQTSVDVISAEFTYNGLHGLHTRSRMGATTTYCHNYALGRAPIVAEKNAEGYQRMYVHTPGGALLYSFDPNDNSLRYYHYDRQGSTFFLTSETGAVTNAYWYDPFGNPLGQSGQETDQPFTYQGQWGARWEPVGRFYETDGGYYDPATASFLLPSPGPGSLVDPASLNPYPFLSPSQLAKATGPAGRSAVGRIVTDCGRTGIVVEDTGEGLIVEGIGPGRVGQITTDEQGNYGIVVQDIGEGLIVEGLAAPPPSMSKRLSVIKDLLPPMSLGNGYQRVESNIPYVPWRAAENAASTAPPAAQTVARGPDPPPAGNDDAAKLEVAARYVGASSAVRMVTLKPSVVSIAYDLYKLGGTSTLGKLAGKANFWTAAVMSYIEVGVQLYTLSTEGTGAAAKEAGLIYSAVSWLYDQVTAPSAPTPATAVPNVNGAVLHRGVQPLMD